MELSNGVLSVAINERGAELTGAYNHLTEIDYIWHGGKEWPKYSPLLFPIVGGLKNGEYEYKGKTYKLSRHGFAREKDFTVIQSNKTSAWFSLSSDDSTLEVYPFPFELQVRYHLEYNSVTIAYHVMNKGRETMLFSIGGHPAFGLPFEKGLKYEDYFLLFNKPEKADRWPVTSSGLISSKPEKFFRGEQKLNLRKDLFLNDALVFKNLNSDQVSIVSYKSSHGIDLKFSGFPYLGIWAAKNADFVCIEPWHGIGDHEDATGRLEEKQCILKLEPGGEFSASWKLRVF